MTEKDLTKDLNYIDDNRKSLETNYMGKYVLVHDGELVDSFDSYDKAATEGIRMYGTNGDFLVKQILAEEPVNLIFSAKLK